MPQSHASGGRQTQINDVHRLGHTPNPANRRSSPRLVTEGHLQFGQGSTGTFQTEPQVGEERQRRREAEQVEFEAWPSSGSFGMWTMNVRDEIARGSNRQAMPWIKQSEQAKKLSDLVAPLSVAGIAAGDFQTWDSLVASGLMKILNGDFCKESSTKKKQHNGSPCS